MKRTVISFALHILAAFCLFGCGGGGGSSSSESSGSDTGGSSSSSSRFSSLVINPLSELGLTSGDNVCFRVKSYNNVSESDFSKPICGKINDNNKLTLSWNRVSGYISGYYVYFGTNKNNATNFLADVIEG